MQLNIFRFGGSGARIVASGFATRGGKVLRRMVGSAPGGARGYCMVVRVAAGCCKALYGSGWVMNHGSVRDVLCVGLLAARTIHERWRAVSGRDHYGCAYVSQRGSE